MGSNSAIYDPCIAQPNVQEMVRLDPFQVPDRYIRDRNDTVLHFELSGEDIPTIDLSLLIAENKDELQKLDLACKEWGFFQIVNHGVAKEVTKNIKDSAKRFFDLPLEERNKIAMPPNDIQGYGHSHSDEILDWSDKLVLVVNPHQYRKLDFWPPSPFREAIDSYSSEMKRIGEELLSSISSIMGVEKDALLGLHQELVMPMSVAYYPPCAMPDRVFGLRSHSDKGSLAVLMQEDVGGLQIKHKGKWVPVNPLTNAFIVNLGDVVEIWSNGKYKSIDHRVVTNESKARISYATFYIPRHDADIEPLDQMVLESPGSLPLYKKVTYGAYLKHTQKTTKEGKEHFNEFTTIAS